MTLPNPAGTLPRHGHEQPCHREGCRRHPPCLARCEGQVTLPVARHGDRRVPLVGLRDRNGTDRWTWMLACPMCSSGEHTSAVDGISLRCPWCGGRGKVTPTRACALHA